MKEIWLIVHDTNVVHGHGMSADEMTLAYKGYDTKAIYPAFLSEDEAQDYIKANSIYGRPQMVNVKQ